MNIFATDPSPYRSAICLPDLHIIKMPLESCQMLALVASPWYHNFGTMPKVDGSPYKTQKGAHRNHPCTKWAAESIHNSWWLIQWGFSLCQEYTERYGKIHGCYNSLFSAKEIYPVGDIEKVTPFVRAMPDEFRFNDSISTFDAYRIYIASKSWVSENYNRKPERKPDWV